ncbi:MAG: biotin-dependent carboxyltransferase family protein [Cyclobacteriaceae bacterium]|nr:hypothetical protein [Cyclobacteriaceae bacterium]MCH8516549.1 biotin-dependent carboxyltransferase family protein [Cyclobacteriaceae bacterium]
MATITFLKAGLFSSIQDGGRRGYRHLGVPSSGFMDPPAAHLANHILRKPADNPCLEFSFPAPHLRFDAETSIVITGADFHPHKNDEAIPMGQRIRFFAGDELSFRAARSGRWSYIAFSTPPNVPAVLGSKSAYAAVTGNYPIKNRKELTFEPGSSSMPATYSRVKLPPHLTQIKSHLLPIAPGPDWALLDEHTQAAILDGEYQLSASISRQAYVLEGAIDRVLKLPDLDSVPVALGIVQLTPAGQLVVLMPDAQNLGGYLRAFMMVDHQRRLLVQAPIGTKYRLRLVESVI